MPAWELTVGGHPLDLGVLIPGLVVPALFFTCLALYPMADRRIAGGRPPRGLLPPTPADLANRTAVGVAGVTFYGLLWAAAPMTRSPTTCTWISTRSRGYSGCSCWPARRWRSASPGSSATHWPTGVATRNDAAGKPGGS